MSRQNPENVRCYFDMNIDNRPAGRVVFQLYEQLAPQTTENFRALCTGEKGNGAFGGPLHYKGGYFHRIIPGFVLQGGDITQGDGTGGASVFGGPFKDESFAVQHDKPFLLSMANAGPDTNTSQFFITVCPAPWLNEKHCVFGEVVDGYEVLQRIEDVGTPTGKPYKRVVIAECGQLY